MALKRFLTCVLFANALDGSMAQDIVAADEPANKQLKDNLYNGLPLKPGATNFGPVPPSMARSGTLTEESHSEDDSNEHQGENLLVEPKR